MPVCTIAIPVYNREILVRAAIESALLQDVNDLEILVIDNASTDGTWDVLRSYRDPRLRLIRNDSNIGLYGNLNRCLELAQGDFLRILCSDDRLLPGCIAREIPIMQANRNVVMVSTRAQRIDQNENPTGMLADDLPPGIYKGLDMTRHALWYMAYYMHNPLNYPSGILLRREVALQTGRFPDNYRLVGDMDFWARLFTHGDVAIADHIGCEIMIHNQQEGLNIEQSGIVLDEFLAIAARYANVLHDRGLEKRVRRQMCGCAVWMVITFLRRNKPDVARLYWRTARSQDFSLLTLFFAFVCFFWMMQMQHRCNIRYAPRLSYRPLSSIT